MLTLFRGVRRIGERDLEEIKGIVYSISRLGGVLSWENSVESDESMTV
jgi:hypothetical protein